MQTINKKRAELLAPIFQPQNEQEEEENLMYGDVDCQFTVNSHASRLLMGTYSYKEARRCDSCTITDSRQLPIISANNSLLPDFSNLAVAVLENFTNPVCHLCSNNLTIVEREFGQCIYIEVNRSCEYH